MSSDSAFLFVDVDGYCAGGVDQRRVVARGADGYRARELGWAFYTPTDHATGSVYFCDFAAAPLAAGDPSFGIVRGMHGLPTHPVYSDYSDGPVVCSSRLLDVFRELHDAVADCTGLPVVIVHKGGNEGVWARRALGDDVAAIDLGLYGCPKVDAIGRAAPHTHVGLQCAFHAPAKRRARKVIHCPRLEVALLAGWVAGCEVSWDAE